MTRIAILSSLLAVCLGIAAQAQTAPAKPGPELQKLHVFVGHWKGEGTIQPGPFSHVGKENFEETDEMILGGFFLQMRVTLKEAGRQDLWVIGYDPVNNNYPATHFLGDGRVTTRTYTLDGSTWRYTGKFSAAGKQYQFRGTATFAADGMSYTNKGEFSPDGNTWSPAWDEKITKAKPGPKK
ncbi:MAG: DUF1579 family protein [Terracidiphilus sp.]|jgi:hypothetical protein